MSELSKYNGYANYPTWNLALWLSNDEGDSEFWREQAQSIAENAPDSRQVRDGIWTEDEYKKIKLAEALKDHFTEANPLGDSAGTFTDILGWAIEFVDWDEIAESILED